MLLVHRRQVTANRKKRAFALLSFKAAGDVLQDVGFVQRMPDQIVCKWCASVGHGSPNIKASED